MGAKTLHLYLLNGSIRILDLELDETRKYLEDDINRDETNFMYQNAPDAQSLGQVINHEKYQFQILRYLAQASFDSLIELFAACLKYNAHIVYL